MQLACYSSPYPAHAMLRLSLVLLGLSACARAQLSPPPPPPPPNPPPFFFAGGCPAASVAYSYTASLAVGGTYFRNPSAVGGTSLRGPSSLLKSVWCVRSPSGSRSPPSLVGMVCALRSSL